MYLWWFDDNPKKPSALKIQEAIAAYVERSHANPNVVLVNEEDRTDISGVDVRSESYIRRHNYWVGWEEAGKPTNLEFVS